MFPVKPNHLGAMAPIPAVVTLPGSSGHRSSEAASIQEELQKRTVELMNEIQPKGVLATFLTERATVHSVRLDRMARYNAAMEAQKVRRAESEFVADRLSEVDHLHSWVNTEPATYSRRLRQSPEGIDRMLDSWRGLRSEITDPDFPRWSGDHQMLAESLTGRRFTDVPLTQIRLYSEAYSGQPSKLVDKTPEPAQLDPAGRQEFARLKLIEIIDAEVARLNVEREAINLKAIEQDRIEAADRALFDAGAAAKEARRHEIASERGFYRALRTIAELEANAGIVSETVIAPENLVDSNPDADPALDAPKLDSPRGKRSRLNVAFIKAAKRAAEARKETIQEPREDTDETRTRYNKIF